MQKSHTHSSSFVKIKQKIGYLKPNVLAKKLKVIKRKNRKGSVVEFLLGYWILISKNQFSFDNWAMHISTITGKTISGQAVWKRITPNMVVFLKALLDKSFKQKCKPFMDNKLFNSFKNVYLQDATHFSLPRFLFKAFPGSYSKYGQTATAKVQAVFNLKKGFFSDFTLSSFRDNDQKDAPRFIEKLNKGDLIIRDLGYFVLTVFKKVNQKGAFFLSRYKYNVSIYDIDTKQQIDLNKLLNKRKRLDINVCIGFKEKLNCRLIAVPLTDKVVSERIRKAKNDRGGKTNHSKAYLELLKYSIYITNVPKEIWKTKDIYQAYKTRWYIEILFKSWKSNLKMKVCIAQTYMTKQRAEFFFYASLLMVNLLIMPIFMKIQSKGSKNKIAISIMKLCSYINQNIQQIIKNSINNIITQIEYYCQYESRKKRTNAIETIYFNVS